MLSQCVNSCTLEFVAVTERRFPPPWTVEDIGAAFVVRDANGQGSRMSIARANRGGDRRRNCSPKTRRGVCDETWPSPPELLRSAKLKTPALIRRGFRVGSVMMKRRYGEPSRLLAIPSRPNLQASRYTNSPSSSKCSLRTTLKFEPLSNSPFW
jgi:hypothetical protein